MAHAFDPDALDPDVRLLRNFDEAWLANRALIREIIQQEKQAEEDRAFAANLAGVTLNPIPDNVRKRAMLYHDYDDDDIDNEDEPTTVTNNTPIIHTTTNIQSQPKPKKCAVCMETVNKNDPHTPCGHAYCIGCLKELFKTSMQDESLMPPRCCREEIPIDLAKLTPKETEDFYAKSLECSTTDRLYCSQPTCSTFIPPASIVNSVGTCPKLGCGVKTCSICKAASHGNLDCPKDEATAAVLALASEAGWIRCYRCRAVVELTQGCYHMTCRCRAEFCYLCKTPWKNCECVQWDEERLYEEAHRAITARVPDLQLPQTNNRVDLVQRVEMMANQLRANYECRHTARWVYTPGGGRCEGCNHYLPQYLFRCSRCHLMACNRCRHNRF